MNAAVIVAGGSSRRMGYDKVTAPLAGMPMVSWSVRLFQGMPEFDQVIVVVHEGRQDEISELLAKAGCDQPTAIIAGGKGRMNSVWNGIEQVCPDSEHVAVHDSARPLVSRDEVRKCLEESGESGAAALAAPVVDSLARTDEAQNVVEAVSRQHLWAAQTPQIFRLRLLIEAYETWFRDRAGEVATDEVSVVLASGLSQVRYVEASRWNFKITTPADMGMAEAVLAHRAASE